MKYETKRSDFSFLTLIVMTLLVPILIVFCIYANPVVNWAANILTGMQTLESLEGDLVEAIEDHNRNSADYHLCLDAIIDLAEEIGTLETEVSYARTNLDSATASAKAAKKEMKRILKEIAKRSPEDPEVMSLWSDYYAQLNIKVTQEALADAAGSVILSNTWTIAWKRVLLGFFEGDIARLADLCSYSSQKVTKKQDEFANLKTLIDQQIQEAIDRHVETHHNGDTTHTHNPPE